MHSGFPQFFLEAIPLKFAIGLKAIELLLEVLVLRNIEVLLGIVELKFKRSESFSYS